MAPRAGRSEPDRVPPFAASGLLLLHPVVQPQEGTDTELRGGRHGSRETRGGGAGRSGVYSQWEGQEPDDEDWLRLVRFSFLQSMLVSLLGSWRDRFPHICC